MSEELLHTVPQSIGKYTYLALGETTIRQLMENGYIPRRTYKGILRKKPDGIAFYQKSVKAIVEYKAPEKLRTDTDVQKAIDQEIAVAKALCKILIVTDGQHSYWVNALNGEQIRDTKGNLINTVGTFGYVDPFTDESKQYDYILSNPPYVISGTKIIKEELRKTAKTKGKYTINAVGLESLGVEWIVNSLKPGGKAFVVIPDGILGRVVPGSKRLRQFILDKCYLDAIVSLPVRTFFANYEHTYIIALTKKDNPALHQDFPVFTYLVSNIGERLTSVKREAIDDNDLPEMIRLFKMYSASRSVSKDYVEQASRRCKIFNFETFEKGDHWVIDRWWNETEKIEIGIFEAPHSVTKDELEQAMSDFQIALREYETFAEKIEQGVSKFTRKSLGDKKLFKLRIGKRVLKDNLIKHAASDLVPVFSANAIEPFGYVSAPNRSPSTHNSILWGIDGNFNFNVIPKGRKYIITDHCGAIDILLETIIPDYLLYALQEEKRTNDFDRSFRASLTNIRKFQVRIPIKADGSFDVDEQQRIAADYKELCRLKEQLNEAKAKMDDLLSHYTKL